MIRSATPRYLATFVPLVRLEWGRAACPDGSSRPGKIPQPAFFAPSRPVASYRGYREVARRGTATSPASRARDRAVVARRDAREAAEQAVEKPGDLDVTDEARVERRLEVGPRHREDRDHQRLRHVGPVLEIVDLEAGAGALPERVGQVLDGEGARDRHGAAADRLGDAVPWRVDEALNRGQAGSGARRARARAARSRAMRARRGTTPIVGATSASTPATLLHRPETTEPSTTSSKAEVAAEHHRPDAVEERARRDGAGPAPGGERVELGEIERARDDAALRARESKAVSGADAADAAGERGVRHPAELLAPERPRCSAA